MPRHPSLPVRKNPVENIMSIPLPPARMTVTVTEANITEYSLGAQYVHPVHLISLAIHYNFQRNHIVVTQ